MTEINEEMRRSLIDAGIGLRFHNLSLTDLGEHGRGMFEWLKEHGTKLRSEGMSVTFTGTGYTDLLTMLARALHLNGLGCKVVPLVRMTRYFRDPQFAEAINDADVLVLLNAQDSHKGCPLSDNALAEVEEIIRKRYDARRPTIIQFSSSPMRDENQWWSDDFVAMIQTWHEIDPEDLRLKGKDKQKS